MFVASYRNTERGIRARDTELPIIREAKKEAAEIIRAAKRKAMEEAHRIVDEARSFAKELMSEAAAIRDNAKVVSVRDAAKYASQSSMLDCEDSTPAIELIKQVADKHGISVSDLKSESRNVHIVAIRHEAMALVYEKRPDLSLPQIGKIFGRDHTTVLAAVRKMGVYRPDARFARSAPRSCRRAIQER